MELAGEIEKIGPNVSKFKVGDQAFASTIKANFGAYAEYKCIKENNIIAIKPTNITYEEAATIPNGGFTALGIIKQVNITKGTTVLIYGSSGSVGTFAVQFAKNFGAEVTTICSSTNIPMVKSLGADKGN